LTIFLMLLSSGSLYGIWAVFSASQLKSWPFGQPFFLILNLAIGGTMGGPVPAPAALPYRMAVDYVRLYNAEISQ